jgi:hypothetical protein
MIGAFWLDLKFRFNLFSLAVLRLETDAEVARLQTNAKRTGENTRGHQSIDMII